MSSELDTDHLEVFARGAVAEHGMPDAEITLLNVSENATFRADSADGRRLVLRVHRTGYHSREAIESELAWISALRADGIVHTAPVIPTPDGRDIVAVRHPGGEERQVVAFEWMNGHEPPEDRLVDDFRELGAITARLHRHAREWQRPAGFTRFRWDFDTSLGANGHWGRWQDGLGMGPSELEVLGRAADAVQRRLAAFGAGPDRFGLVHADMRLANLLVDGDSVCVIDFDDCGLSWYLYDLGSSLSFIEHLPVVPELHRLVDHRLPHRGHAERRGGRRAPDLRDAAPPAARRVDRLALRRPGGSGPRRRLHHRVLRPRGEVPRPVRLTCPEDPCSAPSPAAPSS